jgi:uncharacterized protein YjbJ (UPF0337 family)
MDDRIEGAAKQVKGSIKEAIGILIGDGAIEAEGAAEKAAGKAQHAAAISKRHPDKADEPPQ